MALRRFSVNRQVVHETFDDEIVIINLANGNYYTLSEVAADIWSRIEQGRSESEILTAMTQGYLGEPAQIEDSVSQFLAQLEAEELIWPLEGGQAGVAPHNGHVISPPSPIAAKPSAGSQRLPFAAPVLQKYMDMQALLVLDPIHEVDEMGWPSARQP